MRAFGEVLEGRRDYAVRRSRIVAAHPALQERELLKLGVMAELAAESLRARGVEELVASLAAQSAVAAFHVAFGRWLAAGGSGRFGDHLDEAATALRALR
jgi:hypothetical protein